MAIRRPTAYLLRENGMVDCVKRGGIVSKTIVPPSGEWRAPVVMRTSKGHLLRGDALLSERVSLSRGGSCSPLHSSGLAAKSPSTLYPCPSSRNEAHDGATMQYYVRSDGGVDCVRKNGRTTTIPAPEKSEYIASSATYGGGEWCFSHFVLLFISLSLSLSLSFLSLSLSLSLSLLSLSLSFTLVTV